MNGLFPNLSAEQLAALHKSLKEPLCFLLLEIVAGRHGPAVFGHELYPRAWATHGFARRPAAVFGAEESLPLTPAADLHQAILAWLEGDGLHPSTGAIALVFDAGLPDRPIAELRAWLQTLQTDTVLRASTAVQRRDGRLYKNAHVPLTEEPVEDASHFFELWLEGANSLKIDGLKLPLTAGVQFPAAGDRALLRVRAIALDNVPPSVPADAWYRLTPPPGALAAARVRVDVRPMIDPARDRWELSWVDGPGKPTPIPPPPTAGAWGAAPALHLAVIFDRTCPDAAAWPAARQLFFRNAATRDVRAAQEHARQATGISAMAEATTQGEDAAAEPRSPRTNSDDLNRALREGLWPALRDGLERLQGSFREIVIHPAWFGDTATPQFDPIESMPRNVPVADILPAHAPGAELDHLFRALPYMPSFDVFDPLELALHGVNERLRERLRDTAAGPVRAAILIVGNSPPGFAPEGEERKALARYWSLGRAQFCPRSRPGKVRWSAELEAAARLGVPVIYTLLSLDPTAAAGADHLTRERAAHVAAMESCTREALSLFEPKVHITDAASATPEGLQKALRQALELVAEGATRQNPSSLIVTQ